MSVLLSITLYCLLSIAYMRYYAFQIGSFGYIQQDRVVFGLGPDFEGA